MFFIVMMSRNLGFFSQTVSSNFYMKQNVVQIFFSCMKCIKHLYTDPPLEAFVALRHWKMKWKKMEQIGFCNAGTEVEGN